MSVTGEQAAEYRRWYTKGWRYSASGTGSLDYADGQGFPEAWYDGYMDMAAGRAKWHLAHCVGGCGEPSHDGREAPLGPAPPISLLSC